MLLAVNHTHTRMASSVVASSKKVLSVAAQKGLLVAAVSVVVIVYGVALSMLRKSELASGVASNPVFESLAATSVAALLAAAVSTAGLDSLFDSSHASPLGKFALRFVSYTVAFALVMLLTTQISGRLPAAIAASARSPAETAVCTEAVAKANAEIVAKFKQAGFTLPPEAPATYNDGGAATEPSPALMSE